MFCNCDPTEDMVAKLALGPRQKGEKEDEYREPDFVNSQVNFDPLSTLLPASDDRARLWHHVNHQLGNLCEGSVPNSCVSFDSQRHS